MPGQEAPCLPVAQGQPHTQRGLPSSSWAPSSQEVQGPCCSAGPRLCVPAAASRCTSRWSAAWEVSVQTHQHWTWQPCSSLHGAGQQQQQVGPPWLHCPIPVTAGATAALSPKQLPWLAPSPLHSCVTGMASGSAAPPLNPQTWRNLLDYMTLYLGFLHKHQGLTQPMLKEYLSPTSFSQFMAFQLARSCGAVHVGRQVRCNPNCSSPYTPHSALCLPVMHCQLKSSYRPDCPSIAGHC